jgi:DNA-binding response OmpR family regulator
MAYVLVVSRNANCRRLYVDNLVRRGYLAVGVASAGEAGMLLETVGPDLILICCMSTGYEADVEQFRANHKLEARIVFISQDLPDPAWAARWRVLTSAADPMDVRLLTETLRPWLPERNSDRHRSG